MIPHGLRAVFRRELKSRFYSPATAVFMLLFLFATGVFTFYAGGFLDRDEADLIPFFTFHPYIYLLFMPALSGSIWSEERKSGTIELLFTLPVTKTEAVLGKFFAVWAFAAAALAATLPIWISVSVLGNPDHGMILTGYIGSLLLAGLFLAAGGYVSARTDSQVTAFVLSAVLCFLMLMTGFPLVQDAARAWLPSRLADMLGGFSALEHFGNFTKGVLDLRSLVYFGTFIPFWLALSVLTLERGE